MNGNTLLTQLAALASPHRLRIIAALKRQGPNYVSQLARDLQMSRPLLHLHLQKLQEAGLVESWMEISPDGRALAYFDVAAFAINIDPATIATATKTLTAPDK